MLFGTSPDNLSIVIPLPDKIFLLRDQIFASSDSLSPLTPGSSAEQMHAEAANVVVYNGSSSPGLSEKTADLLKSQGMNVIQTGTADQHYPYTTLVDHTGNPFTIRYLADLMKVSEGRLILDYQPDQAAGVEIYLGDDWAGKVP